MVKKTKPKKIAPKKNAQMASFGKKGVKGLRARFKTKAEFSKYMSDKAKKRWRKHPDQRSAAHKAKVAAKKR